MGNVLWKLHGKLLRPSPPAILILLRLAFGTTKRLFGHRVHLGQLLPTLGKLQGSLPRDAFGTEEFNLVVSGLLLFVHRLSVEGGARDDVSSSIFVPVVFFVLVGTVC